MSEDYGPPFVGFHNEVPQQPIHLNVYHHHCYATQENTDIRQCYLSMSPLCSDELGIRAVIISVLSINSFTSAFPSRPLDREPCSWCTLIAESNPAVMRSEEFASYKHRQMPLPLYNNPREVQVFIITT